MFLFYSCQKFLLYFSKRQRCIGHSSFKMAEHDLTSLLGAYLDQHLVFPLFEFLAVQGVSKIL